MSRYSHKGKTFIGLKKTQDDYLKNIGSLLDKDTLPDTITQLQDILKPLLNNIFVDGPFSQLPTEFNIADTTTGYDNIYTLPAQTANLDVEKYKAFLKFMIQKLYENNTGFSQNTPDGEIITSYCINDNEEDITAIENIKKRYIKLYKIKEPKTKYETKNKQNNSNNEWKTVKSKKTHKQNTKHDINYESKYPEWVTDLLNLSKKILYEEIETKLGIKNILQQNDTEFLETIKKRTDGLLDCSKTKTDEHKKEFYFTEYKKYKQNSDNTNLSRTAKLNKKKEIEKQCKKTIWGIKDYEYIKKTTQELENEFDDFKQFIETTPNELIFMKSFIPPDYFIDNDTPNWESIKELMLSHNRNFKQYVFGYTEDIEHYSKYKTFFELLNMDFNNTNSETDNETCNLLVLWNMVSNLYFNRCAISNTQIPFSIRFILPKKEFNNYDDKTNTFTIKKTIPINPFLTNTDFKLHFIGFINIKFYHEQSQTFRNWILLLFKNDDLDNEFLLDYFTGNIPKIIVLDYKFEYVNNGALLSRNAVTYEELSDFIKRSEHNEISIYQSSLGNKSTLFISPNNYDLPTLKHLNSLQLTKINLEKNLDYKFKIVYNDSNKHNMRGGNMSIEHIKLEFSNTIIDLYDDTLTTTKTYSEYFKNCNLINNYDDAEVYECYKRLYNYLLISSDEIQYSFLNTLKYEKKYHIPKYIPLSNKFYSLYEILIKYNILNNCNKNDTILNIGYNMTVLEILNQKNYKFNNINCIIPSNTDNYYKYISN